MQSGQSKIDRLYSAFNLSPFTWFRFTAFLLLTPWAFAPCTLLAFHPPFASHRLPFTLYLPFRRRPFTFHSQFNRSPITLRSWQVAFHLPSFSFRLSLFPFTFHPSSDTVDPSWLLTLSMSSFTLDLSNFTFILHFSPLTRLRCILRLSFFAFYPSLP